MTSEIAMAVEGSSSTGTIAFCVPSSASSEIQTGRSCVRTERDQQGHRFRRMDTATREPRIVLILGSAPDAVISRQWDRSAFTFIVAINNAWAIRTDWDYLIYPDDFPGDRLPSAQSSFASVVKSDAFVPAQNAFGGFVYAGGTMAFTAAYWALHALKPDVVAFFGCDMVYPKTGRTHFYGNGTADPLRRDITLRSLEAKSGRLFVNALRGGAICLNLSSLPESRLVFPRVKPDVLERLTTRRIDALRAAFAERIDFEAVSIAQSLEGHLGYFVEDGRYWERTAEFSEAQIDRIDGLWATSTAQLPKSANAREICWRGGMSEARALPRADPQRSPPI